MRVSGILMACFWLSGSAIDAVARAADPPKPQVGQASFYGKRHEGRKTASGKRFDKDGKTAAHRTLPLGSVVTVTNLATGRSTDVRITDRGPYVRGRVIDLSEEAAEAIGLSRRDGTAKVRIQPK